MKFKLQFALIPMPHSIVSKSHLFGNIRNDRFWSRFEHQFLLYNCSDSILRLSGRFVFMRNSRIKHSAIGCHNAVIKVVRGCIQIGRIVGWHRGFLQYGKWFLHLLLLAMHDVMANDQDLGMKIVYGILALHFKSKGDIPPFC